MSAFINDNGILREAKAPPYILDNGVWKKAKAGWILDGGVWKVIWKEVPPLNDAIIFNSVYFGNDTKQEFKINFRTGIVMVRFHNFGSDPGPWFNYETGIPSVTHLTRTVYNPDNDATEVQDYYVITGTSTEAYMKNYGGVIIDGGRYINANDGRTFINRSTLANKLIANITDYTSILISIVTGSSREWIEMFWQPDISNDYTAWFMVRDSGDSSGKGYLTVKVNAY